MEVPPVPVLAASVVATLPAQAGQEEYRCSGHPHRERMRLTDSLTLSRHSTSGSGSPNQVQIVDSDIQMDTELIS